MKTKYFLLIILLLSPSLYAVRYEGNKFSRSFEMRKNTQRVDTFDFTGEYPLLENIDIDARRNKRVKFFLNGDYPLLESVNYEGAFGVLTADLTGKFPKLSLINILCTSCAMDLDLHADWERSCEINIVGQKEDIVLKLPKDVGIKVNTRVGLKGKVIVGDGLKKQGKLGMLKKTYHNDLYDNAPFVLIINVDASEGRIILQTE